MVVAHVNNFRQRYHDLFFTLFRVAIGVLFFFHGIQKLFGLFGAQVAAPFSAFWAAGVIEIFAGTLIALGLFVSYVTIISALEMLYAYITVHLPMGAVPLVNKGELALLYLVAFLIIFTHGAGPYSVDAKVFKNLQ